MCHCAEDDSLCVTVRRTTVCVRVEQIRCWDEEECVVFITHLDMGNEVGLGNGGIHFTAGRRIYVKNYLMCTRLHSSIAFLRKICYNLLQCNHPSDVFILGSF